mgnify:CR=1 FL=1
MRLLKLNREKVEMISLWKPESCADCDEMISVGKIKIISFDHFILRHNLSAMGHLSETYYCNQVVSEIERHMRMARSHLREIEDFIKKGQFYV